MPVPANESPAGSYDADLLLQAEGVTKTFPGVKALSGMRLDLRKGEVLALVGENGARSPRTPWAWVPQPLTQP